MLQMLMKVNWGCVGKSVFMECGYPDQVIEWNAAKRKRQLDKLILYTERYLGYQRPVLWRWEWETRKTGALVGELVPHVHLVWFNTPWIDCHRVNRIWSSIIAWNGHVHTDTRGCQGGKGAAFYVADYCAKPTPADYLGKASYCNSLGRAWGLRHDALLPFHEKHEIGLMFRSEVAVAKRIAKLKLPWYDPDLDQGFTLIGKEALELGQRLMKGAQPPLDKTG